MHCIGKAETLTGGQALEGWNVLDFQDTSDLTPVSSQSN